MKRHTVDLPFLCLEKHCRAAFETRREARDHAEMVHGTNTVSMDKEEAKSEKELHLYLHLQRNGRPKVDTSLTPPEFEMPRKHKKKKRGKKGQDTPATMSLSELGKVASHTSGALSSQALSTNGNAPSSSATKPSASIEGKEKADPLGKKKHKHIEPLTNVRLTMPMGVAAKVKSKAKQHKKVVDAQT
ncbi:hypothetical protein CYLTODRAFT_414826 [Cylindrobasidium torrendii FP15055 ss-10]|uniref:C2H2-type domain-containing protein n=1 Tax=Cylindrobasidium torrendii FP15055 ss-10 TaxID=1314674 RepID=A0A0D7AWS4_9AGAR|nr:hypothetical protein CYLTODRAFT_414826 [Cylindrobasidium torrendii FP15055 ss-10]